MKVTVVSPGGKEVQLMERSKMHYLDESTFFAVLKYAWKCCEASDGMGFEQLEVALNPKNVPCAANSVEAGRLPSIRFLEMKLSRKGYMKKIVDLQRGSRDYELAWPERVT